MPEMLQTISHVRRSSGKTNMRVIFIILVQFRSYILLGPLQWKKFKNSINNVATNCLFALILKYRSLCFTHHYIANVKLLQITPIVQCRKGRKRSAQQRRNFSGPPYRPPGSFRLCIVYLGRSIKSKFTNKFKPLINSLIN